MNNINEALRVIENFIDTNTITKDNSKDFKRIENIKNEFKELKYKVEDIIEQNEKYKLNGKEINENGSNNNTNIIDYNKYIVSISQKRTPSALRESATIIQAIGPSGIFFGPGNPNSDTFPFLQINLLLKDGNQIEIKGDTLTTGLKYLPSAGYIKLINLLKKLQEKVHGPQDWSKRDLIITSGAQEGTYLVACLLLNPGDPIILQNPVYPGFADILKPMGMEFLPVDQDKDGMIPEQLEMVLENRSKTNKKMPKVLYVNPTASNPAGTLLSDERKIEIYKIAQKYDLIILEDDPYYFLHFMEKDPMSLLSLDTDGRVVRFDSFSKILSSGLRVGYVTGPKQILKRAVLHVQGSSIHCAATSQVIVHEVLALWGDEGLKNHLTSIRQFYKARRDCMLQCADKYITGLAEWNVPPGGMFLWLKLKPVRDLKDLVTKELIKHKLVVAPGYAFIVSPDSKDQYIRLSYSIANFDQFEKGMKILSTVLRENIIR